MIYDNILLLLFILTLSPTIYLFFLLSIYSFTKYKQMIK